MRTSPTYADGAGSFYGAGEACYRDWSSGESLSHSTCDTGSIHFLRSTRKGPSIPVQKKKKCPSIYPRTSEIIGASRHMLCTDEIMTSIGSV